VDSAAQQTAARSIGLFDLEVFETSLYPKPPFESASRCETVELGPSVPDVGLRPSSALLIQGALASSQRAQRDGEMSRRSGEAAKADT
jgi:hypothetical protein